MGVTTGRQHPVRPIGPLTTMMLPLLLRLLEQEIINHRSNVDTECIANDVLNMTREEVIQRLRELIDSPTLQNQLEWVREDEFIIRYYFIYSDTDHLTN